MKVLCIAVAPESRRLGKVDLFNAAPQCDLIEFRLDRLGKEPDLKEMLEGISKPILVSCRRRSDGGHWSDSEEDRLLQLRTAIIAGPAYVELELDVAAKIPRFGSTKRVVSFTSLEQPLTGVESLIEQARGVQADVVKFTAPTPTLVAAWPLLAAVSRKRDLPVVGMGLGRPGIMFSLLGLKYGAPWVYAALERGLEAYPGQQTITEFEEQYHWRGLGPQTKLVAVVGFGADEQVVLGALNRGFTTHGLNVRCLPLDLGVSDKLPQMLEQLHINVMVCNPAMGERALNLATVVEESAKKAQYADFLIRQSDGWHAFNLGWKNVLRRIEADLGARSSEDRPLDKRNTLIVGTGGLARSLAWGVQRRRGLLSVTGADDAETRQFAQLSGARYVPAAQIYDTLCDVVVLTEAQRVDPLTGEAQGAGLKLNPAFLRPHMHVVDLTQMATPGSFAEEARLRGCKVVDTAAVFADTIASIFKSITARELDPGTVSGVIERQVSASG